MPYSTLHTDPPLREVTTDMHDRWAIDFASALQPGEAIVDASAALIRATPPYAETLHPGFVVGVTVDGTRVLVEWDGSALVKGERYRLETLATLTGGLAVEALTEVHCIA